MTGGQIKWTYKDDAFGNKLTQLWEREMKESNKQRELRRMRMKKERKGTSEIGKNK
jgi:hypothetical protein